MQEVPKITKKRFNYSFIQLTDLHRKFNKLGVFLDSKLPLYSGKIVEKCRQKDKGKMKGNCFPEKMKHKT